MRVALLTVVAAAASVLFAATARADAGCGKTPGLVCSQVVVPLDRSGATPGTIALRVETLPADGTPAGAMFLIAGGPGQGSAHVFDLGSPSAAALYRAVFPHYTLVAYDDRGTGASGLLDCPALQEATTSLNEAPLAAACADSIGSQRSFYGTRDHAEDLDAVRQSLGLDKVGLWGVSYGTKLALAYALAHPTHVSRLLLDSVVPTDLPDSFSTNVLQAMPGTLAAYCATGACRAATPDYAGDVAAVANQLEASPLNGPVLQPDGKAKTVRLDGVDFLSVVLDSDLNPGDAATLPAAVHAARLGNTRPLLRLYDLDAKASASTAVDLSAALFAATVCRDGPFPWRPDTPLASRPGLLQAALAALPAGAFGPFGSWASGIGNASFCLQWPTDTSDASLGPGPLPDVPVLALSGGLDLRTPTVGAASVVARFPQGQLLVVPGVGHSVLTSDPSGCALRAVRSWMLDGPVPASCNRAAPLLATMPAFPAPRAKKAGAQQTLSLVSVTLREAAATWLLMSAETGKAPPTAGLYGGTLTGGASSFTLAHYSIAPGVALTGTLKLKGDKLPFVFQGAVRVSGMDASAGLFALSGPSLRRVGR